MKLLFLSASVTFQLVLISCCYALQSRFVDGNSTQPVLSEKDFSDLIVKTYGYRRKIENVTLEDGSHVSVTDLVVPFAPYRRLVVNRIVQIKEGFHSSVKLQTPEKMTNSTIDTSQWKVDHSFLFPHTYYIRMIEAIFYSDLIKLSKNSNAKILSIGLGGGTVDGFLHEVFPQMDITVVEISRQMVNMARKWFDLIEDDHHRIEVADGVAYLAEKARIGTSYDAILLDACHSEHMKGINCPSEIFYSDQVLTIISRLLPTQGILVINALSMRLDPDYVYQTLTKKLHVHFTYCERIRKQMSRNQVIYCLHRAPAPKPPIDIYKFLKEMEKM